MPYVITYEPQLSPSNFFPGPAGTQSTQVDTSTLPAAEAAEWERLVDEANFFDRPAESDPGRPGAGSHAVTVTSGSLERKLVFHDPVSDQSVQRLLAKLRSRL